MNGIELASFHSALKAENAAYLPDLTKESEGVNFFFFYTLFSLGLEGLKNSRASISRDSVVPFKCC